jgi:hypothetical protein
MRVRAHNNNDTNTNINTNYNNTYNNNNIFRAHDSNINRSCFHNSNGVLKTIAQGIRIEGGLCEFARTQQHTNINTNHNNKYNINNIFARARQQTIPVARV